MFKIGRFLVATLVLLRLCVTGLAQEPANNSELIFHPVRESQIDDFLPPWPFDYVRNKNFPDSGNSVRVISPANNGVLTGFIDEWWESGGLFNFDDFVPVQNGIIAWWSRNTATRGWFYGWNSSTQVAHATGITDISEITDATDYAYDDWVVGPVSVGEFVLFRSTQTNYYAAFRVDSIYDGGNLLNVTWYFQADGTPDFSSFSPILAVRFFTENNREGIAPYPVLFTDLSIATDSTQISSWAWDFDDDGIIDSEAQNPIWTYSEEGTYTVSLTVTDGINSSTQVAENFILVLNENTALFVSSRHHEFQWSVEPAFTRDPVNSAAVCDGCFPIGYTDFDQTWGAIPVPLSRKIFFMHFEACDFGKYDLYIVNGSDPSGVGTLVHSVNSPSYCSWSAPLELDISFLTENTFFLRIDNNDNSAVVTKFAVQLDMTPTDALIWIPEDVIEPDLARKAAERELSIEVIEGLVASPTSHIELKAALEANGRSALITNTLAAGDLANTSYLFVVLGIFPNNHIIRAADPEAGLIESFIAAGGKVYMEGGDMWYFDPQFLGGHDFGPSFSIDPLEDGDNDLKTLLGFNIAAGKDFTYSGQNNFIDRLQPFGPAFTVHANTDPAYDCGVGNESPAGSRTVGNSFEFGGLDDASLTGATKTALMADYLDFFDNGVSLETASFDFPLTEGGWYLISLPVISEDSSVNSLFPAAIAAFGWDFATQSYVPATALQPGQGYWLAMPSASSVDVTGLPFTSYNRTYTQSGWDMLGAVMQKTGVNSEPNGNVFAMFGYNPLTGSYEPVNAFKPKQGYWLAVLASAEQPLFISIGSGGALSTGLAKSGSLTARYGAAPPGLPPFVIAEDGLQAIPSEYGLSQNYPNPFNPETVIEYQLPEPGKVSLTVYSILGQKVRALVDSEIPAGYHRVTWDGKNNRGQKLASGVYLYRIEADGFVQTHKVVLLK